MLIVLNGREVDIAPGATLSEAIAGEPYLPGALIAITRSTSSIQRETSEFEVVTSRGSMVIRLNDSEFATIWRELVPQLVDTGIRWQTSKVTAIGSFPTSLDVDRGRYQYARYDAFLALGGFDNRTTYLMFARTDHEGQYGTAEGKLGRVTRGRHLLNQMREGDKILGIRPVVLELSERDAFVTADLSTALEEGMVVDTCVKVDLDRRSPVSCEQFLVVTEDGRLNITDKTATYTACGDRTDVTLIPEVTSVREEGDVTVRNDGTGTGKIYFYRERRQLSPAHNLVGRVTIGHELLRLAGAGSFLTVVPTPARIMTIGMSQKESEEFLRTRGLKQKRTGLTDDSAVVVEQEPELTMEISDGGEVETYGIEPSKVLSWALDDSGSPKTAHYLRKLTGLDHKPIGTLKVFFTFPEMPMITFEGNAKEASVLLPEKPFEAESPRGQVGVTNMSRPNRGSIGFRLEASPEFGPTGEERYGTNAVGMVTEGLDIMMKAIKDGDIIYIQEVKGPAPAPAPAEAAVEEAEEKEEVEEGEKAEEVAPQPPPGLQIPFALAPSSGQEEKERKQAKKPSGKTKTGGRPRTKRPKQE